MNRMFLVVLSVSLSGCMSWQQKTSFANTDLTVVRDNEAAIRAICPNQRRACYFPNTNTIYVGYGDQVGVIHEFQHYFCMLAPIGSKTIADCHKELDDNFVDM